MVSADHMDLQVSSLFLLLLSFFFLLLIALKRRSISKYKSNEARLPPSPWGLPIVGHIHHLVGKLLHHALHDLAVEHGPVVLLKVGQVGIVAISSREAAEEVLKTHDINFANRPVLPIVGYGSNGVVLSSYRSYWRHLRKICAMELFSVARVKSFTKVREEEIFNVMRDISMTPPAEPVNLRKKLMTLTSNLVGRAAVGQKVHLEIKNDLMPVIKEMAESLSGFSFTDLFPALKLIDVLNGRTLRLKRTQRKLDKIVNDIIKQHQIKRASQLGRVVEEEDLVDVLLRVKEQGNHEGPLTIDGIKALTWDVLFGGTDTSSIALEWAMSELMRNPEVMKKAQKEVREAMGGRTKVEERDTVNLNYLKLVIKETLRLHPPAPLPLPRVAKETCEVLGFKIPAGTRVLINAWALGRDPRYWEDAERFKPERFEGSPVDYKGNNMEYIPFGAGRRMCPGIHFTMTSLELALAQLLFYFDWQLPNGMKPEELDMKDNTGAATTRESELYLLVTTHVPLPSV